jgi:hypothetical protein
MAVRVSFFKCTVVHHMLLNNTFYDIHSSNHLQGLLEMIPYCLSFFLIFYSFIHMCVHCLGHFSLLHPAPPSLLHLPLLPGRRVDISNNKKDKAILLVEIRIDIQRDS